MSADGHGSSGGDGLGLRPFTSSACAVDGHGPTWKRVVKPPDIPYDSAADDAAAAAARASGGGASILRTLQPFGVPSSTAHAAFSSPGMAATLGFPFTYAQWKELERQAIIYKCMVASVPVPPDLLLPFARNYSDPAAGRTPVSGAAFNLRFSSSTDPEPGRCRRTDGKKWRCSRDVAPSQKYCERHMHRGRPRSRKHVEVESNVDDSTNVNKKSRSAPSLLPPAAAAVCDPGPIVGPSAQLYLDMPLFLGRSDQKGAAFESGVAASPQQEVRNLNWNMKGEAVPMCPAEQSWHRLMQNKTGLSNENVFCDAAAAVFSQHYQVEEPPSLSPHGAFGAGVHEPSNECDFFLNPELVSLDKLQTKSQGCLFDAWSSADRDAGERSVSFGRKLPLSALALSMGGNDSVQDELGHVQMGLGMAGSDQHRGTGRGATKPHLSSWVTPASWVASAPGGPLAEVLTPSAVGVISGESSNPPSPAANKGDSDSSHPLTTVSSPSGVLQKTMASFSDSSATSSSSTRPEIGSQWLSQSKLAP